MRTTAPNPSVDSGDALAERIVGLVNASMQVDALYLGDRLGWYRALGDGRPRTADELAAETATDARYALEWLEHQVACGILDLHVGGDAVRFSLPPGHAAVLTDEESLAYALPFATFAASRGRQLDELVEAYRTGGGITWGEMGHDARSSQGAANRPFFLHALGQEVLPAVPDVHAALGEPGARVADVGCGYGWSSIALALAYPGAVVHGVDVDGPSVEAARANAVAAGVADRVRFTHGDAAELLGEGDYDAVFAFECIHDMPDPVRVLDVMRRLAGDDGAVVVMDERVAERLEGPADEVEQLMYGFSLTTCLPDGRAHGPSAATGTVMRPGTLARHAADAGLPRCDVLPVEHDFFRFYRLA